MNIGRLTVLIPVALLSCCTVAAAQRSYARLIVPAPCYATTLRPFTLRNGLPVAAGIDIGIMQDAGSAWITTDESAMPVVNKSDVGRPDCVAFEPAIDAVMGAPSAVYERVPVLGRRTLSSFATQVQPGRDGYVVPKGEPVKISRRESAWFVVDTTAQRQIYVPVANVAVPADRLRTGRTVAIPSQSAATGTPAAAASQKAAPIQGALYGRLRIPLQLGTRTLPAGSYLWLGYDAGDRWAINGPAPAQSPRIAKDAVEIVEKTVYMPPLLGRVKIATPTYLPLPDLDRDPAHLEQSSPRNILTPALRAGQEVNIQGREGDSYLAVPVVAGQAPSVIRVPVAAVEVAYGDVNGGRAVRIPPLQGP